MLWILWVLIGIVVIGLGTFLALPMRVPREPEREGSQEGDAIPAYDRVSGSIEFQLERHILVHELKHRRPGGLLVDVGCGPGYLAAQISRNFPDLNIIGLDINDEMLRTAQHNWRKESYGKIEYVGGEAGRLPFLDNSIDYVVSSLSLHHWPDAKAGLAEAYRVLKPGGRLLIFDLRRDSSRLFYYGLILGQAFSPRPLQTTNGAVGSFWASYTVREIKSILSASKWNDFQIKRQFGWMIIAGQKIT